MPAPQRPDPPGTPEGRWEVLLDRRPIAPSGACCARCGGVTWQHQARDICGECGHIAQHEPPQAPPPRKAA